MPVMTRNDAIANALAHFDSVVFLNDLERLVARPTESQVGGRLPELEAYLTDDIIPRITPLGFASRILPNPQPGRGPFLIAERHEGDGLPTLLIYGHGDTVTGNP